MCIVHMQSICVNSYMYYIHDRRKVWYHQAFFIQNTDFHPKLQIFSGLANTLKFWGCLKYYHVTVLSKFHSSTTIEFENMATFCIRRAMKFGEDCYKVIYQTPSRFGSDCWTRTYLLFGVKISFHSDDSVRKHWALYSKVRLIFV